MERKYKRMEVVPGEIEKLKADLSAALLQIDALRKGEQKIAENVNSWVERYTELEKRYQTALDKLEETNRLNGELIERCASIAESEPWPEGPVPLVVLAASKGLSYEQIVEATVKATRESIARKIRQQTEKRNHDAECDSNGCVAYCPLNRVDPLPTIEDLLGECRECNRLCRDCGNHGPVQR